MSDFFYEATDTEILNSPATFAEALELEVEKATAAFSAMTNAVEAEFNDRLESIGGEPKGITHLVIDKNSEAHPARPVFFAESWQGQERLLDAAWLAELRERADQTQADLSDAEAATYEALEYFEQHPTAEGIGELRTLCRVFEAATERALDQQEMLLRAERQLVLIWAQANYTRRPFQRNGGEMPELVTLNMAELSA
ncbi:hypothetical protein ACNBFH_004438 [Salmonella enterica subsp. enterica serovar Bareilly]